MVAGAAVAISATTDSGVIVMVSFLARLIGPVQIRRSRRRRRCAGARSPRTAAGRFRSGLYNVDMPPPLLRSRLFDGLTDTERASWLARSTPVSLKRAQILVSQGDPARHFYLLETGFLKLLQV